MRPIVNVSEEDRDTDAGNTHKDRACGPGDILADRQTDTQTDILIKIPRNGPRGRSNKLVTNVSK